jgi:hypothetical protein
MFVRSAIILAMRLRTRLAVGAGGAIVFGVAGFWLLALACPDQAYSVYSGTRHSVSEAFRMVKAIGPVQKIFPPNPKSRDAEPCKGVAQPGRQVASDKYFPLGVLSCRPDLDESRRDWYSTFLSGLGEPSLWRLSKTDPNARVYRFLWLRTFHHPVVVRLILNPDLTGLVISKIGSGAGGYEPGRLIRNSVSPTGSGATALFLTKIIDADFWSLRSRKDEPTGTDGSEWIIEGVADGHYQVVDRWCPPDSEPVHLLGMSMLADLAALQIKPEDIY